MIIFTPLDLPKIEPEDWNVFWNIWDTYSDFLVKKNINVKNSPAKIGSNSVWRGLDVYNHGDIAVSWDAPYYDIKKELPLFLNRLLNLPIPFLYKIRIIQSNCNIIAHTDDNKDTWSVRGYLYYTSNKSQWYFTKPKGNKRFYMDLPSDAMWFSYNDKYSWHGTDFDPEHKKLLIQFYYFGNIKSLVDSSIEKYKSYTIDI